MVTVTLLQSILHKAVRVCAQNTIWLWGSVVKHCVMPSSTFFLRINTITSKNGCKVEKTLSTSVSSTELRTRWLSMSSLTASNSLQSQGHCSHCLMLSAKAPIPGEPFLDFPRLCQRTVFPSFQTYFSVWNDTCITVIIWLATVSLTGQQALRWETMPVFAHHSIHPQCLVNRSHSIAIWWMNELINQSSWLGCSHFFYNNYYPKIGFINYRFSLHYSVYF